MVDDMDTPRLDSLVTAIESRHPSGDALARLTDAVILAEHLGDLADQLVTHFVDRARETGASWSVIGESLGVTKQAAQKRFVPTPSGLGDIDLRMFERYSDAARQAVIAAPALAAATGSTGIRPGHLLLALLQGDEGRELVAAGGADPSAVEQSVRGELGAAADDGGSTPGFTPASRKAIQLAHRESLRLGADQVVPAHLLLGVLRVT